MSDRGVTADCPLAELAVGWALHALEPAEEAMITAHLLECARCMRTVDETERVGALMGLSIPEVAPSPELEQRLLAMTNADAPAPVVPLEPAHTRRAARIATRPVSRMFVAASVVLLAGSAALGIRVVQLDEQRDQAVRQVTAMSEAMEQAADPATVRVPLLTEDRQSVGVVLAGSGDVVMVPTGLPGNRTEDQLYVLWGLGHGAPAPLTGFDVAPDEPAVRVVPSVPGAGEFSGYAVSLEPGRHVPAVPTQVVASGQV